MSKIFIGLFLSIFLLSPVAKISAGGEQVGLESESLEGSSSLDPVNPVLGCLLLHSGKMQRMVQNISIPSIDGSRKGVLRGGGVSISRNFDESLRNIIFMLFPSKDKVLSLVHLSGKQLTREDICCLQRYTYDLIMMKVNTNSTISSKNVRDAKRRFYCDLTYLLQGDRFFDRWKQGSFLENVMQKKFPRIGTLRVAPFCIFWGEYDSMRNDFVLNIDAYAERCTINNFVVGPLVRECFCYNGVINNMVFNCTKEKLKFEFEHNAFIYPRFLDSEGIDLSDLKRSKIIDPIF